MATKSHPKGYSGGGIRTRDLRVMSPNLGTRWATWSAV
jgi:hypothetical protein